MEQWTGKVVLITGANSGIGLATAIELAKAGLQVVGISRRIQRLEEAAEELAEEPGKLFPHKCDITNEDEVLATFEWIKEELGGVDILINNAGIFKADVTLIDGDINEWRMTLETNVIGLCHCTREAIRSMKDRDVNGHIIHINSIAGHYVPNAVGMSLNVYAASKHAVTALTETLRQDLVRDESKIKITSISPGFVATNLLGEEASLPEALEDKPKLQPVDVANAILYVLSTPAHVQINELTIRPVGETF